MNGLTGVNPRPLWRGSALLLVALCGFGCANITSISRTNTLPSTALPKAPSQPGKAIHLDIKQRILITKPGRLDPTGAVIEPMMACAEPSPDALSAFASAIGGGASIPTKGAGSASSALNEAASSIGLRTQSITLMRDSLYRICEAYYNGQLSKPQVMLLIARSQDLTATVLAVEQLTGAVVASQAALGGNASASGSATMLANAKALEQIRTLEQKAQAEVAEAGKAKEEAIAKRDEKRAAVEAKKKEVAVAAEGSKPALQVELGKLEKELAPLEEQSKLAENDEANKKKTLESYKSARAAIEQQQDSAITSSVASAGGTSALIPNAHQAIITAQSIEKVAGAVKEIATTVLTKNYITETCVSVLTIGSLQSSQVSIGAEAAEAARAEQMYGAASSAEAFAKSEMLSAYDALVRARDELADREKIVKDVLRTLERGDEELQRMDREIESLALGSPPRNELQKKRELLRSDLNALKREKSAAETALRLADTKATNAERTHEKAVAAYKAATAKAYEEAAKSSAAKVAAEQAATARASQSDLVGTCLKVLQTVAQSEIDLRAELEMKMRVERSAAAQPGAAQPAAAQPAAAQPQPSPSR